MACGSAAPPPPETAPAPSALPAGLKRLMDYPGLVRPHPWLGVAFPGPGEEVYEILAQAGAGHVRLPCDQSLREPRRGEYRWDALDQRVRAAQAQGITVCLNLYYDADWAVDRGRGRVKNGVPKDWEAFRAFVRTAAERYGSREAAQLAEPVRQWMILNEWVSPRNRSGGWAGTDEELLQYITIAAEEIRAAVPGATVILGGIASMNAHAWALAQGMTTVPAIQYMRDGRRVEVDAVEARTHDWSRLPRVLDEAPVDMVSVHLYGHTGKDEACIRLVQKIAGKPVMSGECGAPSLDYHAEYTPDLQFVETFARVLGALAAGAKPLDWFHLRETGSETPGNRRVALMDNRGEPKAGYFAYQWLAYVLRDAVRVEKRNAGHFVIHGRQPIHVLWAVNGRTVVNLDGDLPSNPEVVRIVEAARGLFALEPYTEGHVPIGPLPVIIGADLVP